MLEYFMCLLFYAYCMTIALQGGSGIRIAFIGKHDTANLICLGFKAIQPLAFIKSSIGLDKETVYYTQTPFVVMLL